MLKPAAALFALLCLASPALADQCADDLAKIDVALASKDLPPDQKAQLDDMKKQAQQLCQSGHAPEGLDVLGDAKAMLNIQ